MSAAEEIGRMVAELQRKVEILERASQAQHSTIETSAGTVGLGDAAATAVDTAAALPGVEEQATTAQATADSTAVLVDGWDEELDARLEAAAADLDNASADLEDAQGAVRDAFGQQLTDLSDKVDQIVVGAGGALLLFSDEAPTSDDQAPAGSTWWMLNEAKNIVGQWQQTGTDDAPVWTPRAIESDIIANLDVGKLSAGQAAIAQVVALRIAASTASIQTVNVENMFVTSGATMKQAVIDYLFANVVTAKKITTDMLDVNTFNGVTLTGTIIKTASAGQRLEMLGTRLDVYGTGTSVAASITGNPGNGSSNSGLALTASGPSGTGTCLIYGATLTTLPGVIGDVSHAMYVAAGIATGDFTVRRVFTGQPNSTRFPKRLAIEADSTSPSDPAAGGTRFYGNRFTWMNPYLADDYVDIVKPAYAGSNGVVPASKVIVTAGDFQLLDGTSIAEDTGWVALRLRSGYLVHSGRTPQVRRFRGVTYMRGGIMPGSGSFASTAYQIAADLPAGFIAPGQNSYFLSFVGTTGTSGIVSVEGTTVRLTPGGTGVGYMYLNNVIYFEG